MIQKILFLFALVLVLAACGSSLQGPDQPVSATPVMSEPTPPSEQGPIDTGYLPQPGDDQLTRGNVFIGSSDLLIMESYPIQVTLVLKGELPTPCNQLRVVASPPDEQNRIQVEVYSVINPEQMCIQVLEPFEANIGLGSFPSGHYTVLVNGQPVGEFDA